MQAKLFLGLGGTGSKIIGKLKELQEKREYTRISDVPVPPFILAVVDTDRVSGIDLYHIASVPNPLDVIKARWKDKNFKSWWARDRRGEPYKFTEPIGPGHGAGRYPMQGRLAFWHNYSDIKDLIEKIKQRAHEHEGIDEIFVVASLCGGTGAGMLMDMGFLLRNTFSTAFISAIVLHGEIYKNRAHDALPVTHATLLAIDKWQFEPETYEMRYLEHSLEGEENIPPYDMVFLIERENMAGYGFSGARARNVDEEYQALVARILYSMLFRGEAVPKEEREGEELRTAWQNQKGAINNLLKTPE